ncbi:MAG TPA: hypothetical protein VHJ38_18135 [Nitrososphaeraceae archaeon]|nr:hypothetical protein [Nitrososphaeraceae archaeon]
MNNTKIMLLSLFFILIVITIITIINYNYSSNQLLSLFILAEPDNNNKEKEENDSDNKKEKEDKKEQEQTKEDEDKEEENSNKKSNSKTYQIDPRYRSFFPPTKQIVIPEIYHSVPNGETYRFNRTNPNDQVQVDEGENKKVFTQQNYEDIWRIDGGKPRIDIHTKDAGIIPDKQIVDKNMSKNIVQSWNFSELKKIGYWHKPSDWKNVEVTLIFKLLDSARSKGDQHSISIVTRSISHSQFDNDYKKGPKFFCGGSSYHNNISNEGQIRMKKEQYHIDYEWERYNDEMLKVGNLYNKIVGFKGIVYNINNTAVKLEAWVDAKNQGKGPYKKVHELIDNGNWGDAMTICGAKTNGQAITWGSPTIIIKANDFEFDIYDIEVREIVPSSSYPYI